MSAGRIAQHRNYGELMARHERDRKIRHVVRVFVYFLIILAIIILFVMVKRIERKATMKTPPATSWNMHPAPPSSNEMS